MAIVKMAVPATTSGQGQGQADDIREIVSGLMKDRGEWYLVAPAVPNPNRYFDALKLAGCEVKQRQALDEKGNRISVQYKYEMRPATSVYAMLPKGDIVPHRKPSQVR